MILHQQFVIPLNFKFSRSSTFSNFAFRHSSIIILFNNLNSRSISTWNKTDLEFEEYLSDILWNKYEINFYSYK